LGAAARRKGFGVHPDQLRSVGRYVDCRMRCWQTKGLLSQTKGLLSVNPETLYFYCGHHMLTNVPRSLVCRSVPIPDKLPHGNPDGTNRLQCRQGQ